MVKVLIPLQDVWQRLCQIGDSMVLIAEDPDKGIKIVGTTDEISVLQNNVVIYAEAIIGREDCEQVTKEAFRDFLFTDNEDDPYEFEINDRESELMDAAYEFLSVIVGDSYNCYDEEIYEVCNALMEHSCRFLAKVGLPVYKPTIVDGVYKEYPYENI